MLCAVLEGHAETAALLLERGASVDAGDAQGWTPLMHTTRQGHLDMAAMLVERGADTEATNESGRTAVMEAASSGERLSAQHHCCYCRARCARVHPTCPTRARVKFGGRDRGHLFVEL